MQPSTLQFINLFNSSTYFHSPPSSPHPLTALFTALTRHLLHCTHTPPSFTSLSRRPLHRTHSPPFSPLMLPFKEAFTSVVTCCPPPPSPHSLATLLTALTRRPLHRTRSPPSSPHSLTALFTALTHRPLHRTRSPPSSPHSLTALLAAFGNDLDAAFHRRLLPTALLLPLAAFLCRSL